MSDCANKVSQSVSLLGETSTDETGVYAADDFAAFFKDLDHGSGQPNSGGQTVKTTSGVNNKLWTTPAAVVLPS